MTRAERLRSNAGLLLAQGMVLAFLLACCAAPLVIAAKLAGIL